MPEYLAPGVYVEEVSFRSKSIEGVPTSTTGYAGITRYGPVPYTVEGPDPIIATATAPRLITSFTEFERTYGELDPLNLVGLSEPRVNYTAHAARAFFANGGQRLYVSRVFQPDAGKTVDDYIAKLTVTTPLPAASAQWRARWPGADGAVLIDTQVLRSKNLAFKYPAVVGDVYAKSTWGIQVKTAVQDSVVEVTLPPGAVPSGNDPLVGSKLFVVQVDADGRQTFVDQNSSPVDTTGWDVPNLVIALIQLRVTVYGPNGRIDSYDQLTAGPGQQRFVGTVLDLNNPEDQDAMVWLKWSPDPAHAFSPAALMIGLQSADKRLSGGSDGILPGPDALQGMEADPDVVTKKATGLEALGELDDIAIVALPDAGALGSDDLVQGAADRLIAHAEKYRYRIAVVDPAPNLSVSQIREFRGKFDSSYAALYHPWIEILDPLVSTAPGVPPRKIVLPPSGFVTGIYARNDIQRGVFKAPANEIVRGLTKFEININKGRQDVLNPEGVNCLRFFEGRGNRVWGARTMSSDPEWKYVNVRRLFIYLEHSIDKATQWAVFEPNNERLWANIKSSIEDFLYVLWRDGALIGAKPEEAYFVRCDRTTMTQNDLDNGRMICLVGVAPSRPAEYVIFRVGQWTADSTS
jgi:phage tail sheath protein FI